MATRLRCAFVSLVLVLGGALCAYAQLRPEVTAKPKKPPAVKVTPKPAEKPAAKPEQPQEPPEPEPAQIVIETSPNAEVYLDDQFVGRASPQGRLVVANPAPGERSLRVALAGKRDYEAKVAVVAGEVANVAASLADLPGRILVRSLPGAEVFLDNSSRGVVDTTGQLIIEPVAAGPYEVRISAAGKRDYRQNIRVLVGQETRVEAAPGDIMPAPAGEQTGQVGARAEAPNPVARGVVARFWVTYASFGWGDHKGLMTIDEAAVRYESDGKKRSFVFRLSEIEKVKQLSVWSGRVVEIRLKNGEKYTITSNDSKWSNDAILRAINRAMGRQ